MADTIWSDIHHDVETNLRGDIRIVTNVDAVITSIDNILRTRKGERLWNPEFGSDVPIMVFENLDSRTLEALATEVNNAISRWEPRVKLRSVDITTDPNSNFLAMKCSFVINGYDQIFQYSGQFAIN